MSNDLEFLKYLRRLELAQAEKKKKPMTEVEKLFTEHAELQTNRALDVHLPVAYQVKDAEREHYAEAREALGLPERETDGIGILGTPLSKSEYPGERYVILLSHDQHKASIRFGEDGYLIPVLEELFTTHGQLIKDFTVHEAVIAELSASLGNVKLDDLDKKTTLVKPGKYTISASLSTPSRSIQEFMEFTGMLETLVGNHTLLREPGFFSDFTSKGAKLRRKLTALSRFSKVNTRTLEVEVDSVVTHHNGQTQYHFSTEGDEPRNFIVYTGENPYVGLEERDEFELLSLDNKEATLKAMINAGFYSASSAVLDQRIETAKAFYERLEAEATDDMAMGLREFGSFIKQLEMNVNTVRRYEHSRSLNAWLQTKEMNLLESIVYPTTECMTALILLPKLYERSSLTEYQNTKLFKKAFEQKTEEERVKMLNGITSQLMFEHEQNPEANLWLYENHADVCEKAGIELKVH